VFPAFETVLTLPPCSGISRTGSCVTHGLPD
jgi:hypothetical protein